MNRIKWSRWVLLLYGNIAYAIFLVFFSSCSNESKKDTEGSILTETEALSGERLAKMYCSSCHLFPEPSELDKRTWETSVLPQMAHRYGIYEDTTRESLFEKGVGGDIVKQANIFPEKPLISLEQWNRIKSFYIENSLDSIANPVTKVVDKYFDQFQFSIPNFKIEPPLITAIGIHPEKELIAFADLKSDYSTINIVNTAMESQATLAFQDPISDLHFLHDTIVVTSMGSFTPTDTPSGKIVKVFKQPDKNEYRGFSTLIKDLQRPVKSLFHDLNQDGMTDIIVCEYGHLTGKLSWFQNNGNGNYKRNVLNHSPGAISISLADMDGNGYKDIVALMAQGDEGIDIYYNMGAGRFTMERVLRFPALYGSVALQLYDFNNDGYQDILYTNGDNADFSTVLKPYHGVRIFMNDQKNHFQETFFYPLNGAYKSVVEDFDNDGLPDIAVISFFPDITQYEKEAFLLLKNISQDSLLSFQSYNVPKILNGRWLVMNSTDINNDGNADLVLGSFAGFEFFQESSDSLYSKVFRESPPIMVLINNGK